MSCEFEKHCVSESASEEQPLLCELESVCCAKRRIEGERAHNRETLSVVATCKREKRKREEQRRTKERK